MTAVAQQANHWLHTLERRVTGAPFPWQMEAASDCLAFASCSAAEDTYLAACFAGHGKWPGRFATEPTHGGMREAGGDLQSEWMLRHAVTWLRTGGIFPRRLYKQEGIDLSIYRPETARLWATVGVPDNMEHHGRKHPSIWEVVRSAADVVAHVHESHGVAVSGRLAWSFTRGADGFIEPTEPQEHEGSAHAWSIRGVGVAAGNRPFCIWQDARGPLNGPAVVKLDNGKSITLPPGAWAADIKWLDVLFGQWVAEGFACVDVEGW